MEVVVYKSRRVPKGFVILSRGREGGNKNQ